MVVDGIWRPGRLLKKNKSLKNKVIVIHKTKEGLSRLSKSDFFARSEFTFIKFYELLAEIAQRTYKI